VKLQNIYKQKAESDMKKLRTYLSSLTDKIPDDLLQSFCENSYTLEWINYRSLSQEDSQPLLIESYENDIYKWYFAIKGCQFFENKYKRFPVAKDREELEKFINEELIKKNFANILPVEKEIIEEMYEFLFFSIFNFLIFNEILMKNEI